MISIKNFVARLLEINKKPFKSIGNYNIRYITIKKIDDFEDIYSVNSLYLIIAHTNEYIEEKGANKYLVFDIADENTELLKNTMMFGMELGIKSKK